jgi:DNA-binding transcriptional LysR family regulator
MRAFSPPYRIPSALRDLVLVDMLELSGSTAAAAALMNLSQPTVSRRYRQLAQELGLQRDRNKPAGRRFGDAAWLALLRKGVNRHRLDCGVLRIGGPRPAAAELAGCPWVEWVHLDQHGLQHWPALLQLELLDGVLLDGEGDQRALRQRLVCRDHPLVLALASRHDLEVATAHGP